MSVNRKIKTRTKIDSSLRATPKKWTKRNLAPQKTRKCMSNPFGSTKLGVTKTFFNSAPLASSFGASSSSSKQAASRSSLACEGRPAPQDNNWLLKLQLQKQTWRMKLVDSTERSFVSKISKPCSGKSAMAPNWSFCGWLRKPFRTK